MINSVSLKCIITYKAKIRKITLVNDNVEQELDYIEFGIGFNDMNKTIRKGIATAKGPLALWIKNILDVGDLIIVSGYLGGREEDCVDMLTIQASTIEPLALKKERAFRDALVDESLFSKHLSKFDIG